MRYQRQAVLVLCVGLVIGSILRPVSAWAQAPDPDYIISVGKVPPLALAGEETTCVDIRPLNPKPEQLVILAQANNRLFAPSIRAGGDICTELDPYIGANVFTGDDGTIIPIVRSGQANFEIGSLPTEKLSYTPNQQIEHQQMYNLLHGQLPPNLKSMRLISAWNITLDEASIAQLGDSPVDFPQVRAGWRAHVMDKFIQEGYEFGFEVPVTTIMRMVPDKYRSVINGVPNAQTIMQLCPGIEDAMTSIPLDVQGFTILLNQGPFKNEISAWAFVEYDPVLEEICPQLPAYPWLEAGNAFQVLEVADQVMVDGRVNRETREWPIVLDMIPYPDPSGQPLIGEGNAEAVAWGSVIFIAAVIVIGAATGQPELWILALAP